MSSEDLKSLIVTDPDLLDEGIDVSGLRTQTDTDPRLLASIADFPGISYDPTSFDYLSALNELFAYGLPGGDTSGTTTPPVTTTPVVDTGGEGQETVPEAINTLVTPESISPPTQPIDPTTQPIDPTGMLPQTSPTTGISPTTQPIDPTGMLPQTSSSRFAAAGTLADPLEKDDVLSGAIITAKDAADPTFLDRIGLGQFNPVEAFVKAAINKSIGLPVTFLIDTLVNTLPPQDPRQVALNELYDVQDGTIQSGLMAGYNPVLGNPLDPTYGLQEAYQDRIDTIEDTLTDKYGMTDAEIADVKAGSYTGDVDTDLLDRLNQLETDKAVEKARLDLFSGDIQETGDAGIAEQIAEADRLGISGNIGVEGEDVDRFEGEADTTTQAVTPLDQATGRDDGPAPSTPAKTSQGVTTSQFQAFRDTGDGGGGGGGPSPSKSVSTAGQAGPPSQRGGGGGGGSSGGGKIVCTMMNESYGFGSFRNKIWIKYARDNLSPEYQKGYHKIFLPLVKLSKKNIVLKKVLEHIAIHRTIDIRQESRGKVHLLGRIYRKIFEPICYCVGKYV